MNTLRVKLEPGNLRPVAIYYKNWKRDKYWRVVPDRTWQPGPMPGEEWEVEVVHSTGKVLFVKPVRRVGIERIQASFYGDQLEVHKHIVSGERIISSHPVPNTDYKVRPMGTCFILALPPDGTFTLEAKEEVTVETYGQSVFATKHSIAPANIAKVTHL